MNYRTDILMMQPNRDKRLAIWRALSDNKGNLPNTQLEPVDMGTSLRLALLQRQAKPYTAAIVTNEALAIARNALGDIHSYSPTTTRVVVAPANFELGQYGEVKPHFMIGSDSQEEQNSKLIEVLEDIAKRRQIMVVGSEMKEIVLAREIAGSIPNLQERVNLTLGHTEKRIGEFIDNVPRRYFVVSGLGLKDRSGDHDILAYLLNRGVKKSHIFAYGKDEALQERATELRIRHMLPAQDRPSEELLTEIRRVRDKEKRH
jgi:hypothetical protein